MTENRLNRETGGQQVPAAYVMPRLSGVGANGVKMLLVSNGVLLASLGLSGLAALLRVVWVALRTPTMASPCAHVLVLGVKLRHCRVHGDYQQRLDRAAVLWRQGVAKNIVLVGGRTSRECESEAAAGRVRLLRQGINADALILEERSRHTLENLRHVREMFGGKLNGVIITNRYHLARTAALARGLGLSVVFCAAEDRLMLMPVTLFKLLMEAYYLHWYYSGALWARLVGDHGNLARIR